MKRWSWLIGLLLLTACASKEEGATPPLSNNSLPNHPPESCERIVVYRHPGETFPTEVRIAGDFEVVDWTGHTRLSDGDGDGFWTASVTLKPGTYAYRFIVDDQWTQDLDNPNQVPNNFGEFNSVMTHLCPWEPSCISDSDCDADQPFCRYYDCLDDPNAQPDPETPTEPECDDANPCQLPLVCVEGICQPECTSTADCDAGEICHNQECIEPGCLFDSDCDNPLTEHCSEGVCGPNPCSLHVFTLSAGNATYDSVHVAGSLNAWAPTLEEGGLSMAFDSGSGVWYAKTDLPDGITTYKFVINDGEQWIADPGNPSQQSDGEGGFNSVVIMECDDARCEGDFDWKDAVMYFAMVDRFHNSDDTADFVFNASGGDAAHGPSGQYEGGDLAGLTEKLPYLRDLGVNALWLSAPFENRNDSGEAINPDQDSHLYSAYHGYWPSPANVDYSDPSNPSPTPLVESRIGTADDLHDLVDSAHGIETPSGSGIKVLFDYVMNHVDIDSGLFQAHPDWFISDNGSIPLCGPQSLWEDPYWGTRCAFTGYLPAFDFYQPAPRQWSINDALWWAKEFNIDGYRLDAIKHVPLSWLTEIRSALTQEFPNPGGGRFYLVGETFSYDNRDLLKSFVEPTTMLDGQFDFPFKARVCETLFSFQMGLNEFAGWMDGNDTFYGDGAIMTTWIGNHDVPRAIHFASGQIQNCREGSHTGNSWTSSYPQPSDAAPYERLGLAFAVMMTSPGIPLIYYGDEVGLAGGGDPDNRRTMPWELSELNAHQIALREKVSKLGTLRQNNRALSRGTRTTLHADGDTWVYTMSGCGVSSPDVIVAMNRSDSPKTVPIPAGTYNNLMNDAPVAGGNVELGPRDLIVLQQ